MSRGPLWFRPARPGDYVVVNGWDMDKPVEVLSGPCCAHLRVEYRNHETNGCVTKEWWACRDCGNRFIPTTPTPVLMEEIEALRAKSAAQAERIVELEATVHEWEESDNAPPILGSILAECQIQSLTMERNNLLEQLSQILAALPEDAPCRKPETGVSIADDVRDLAERFKSSQAGHIRCLRDFSTQGMKLTDLEEQLATSEAARKKAEEERNILNHECQSRSMASAKLHDRNDALRQGLDKIQVHLAVLDGFHILTHREDSREVCYDWCPLCHLKDALSTALALLTPPKGPAQPTEEALQHYLATHVPYTPGPITARPGSAGSGRRAR